MSGIKRVSVSNRLTVQFCPVQPTAVSAQDVHDESPSQVDELLECVYAFSAKKNLANTLLAFRLNLSVYVSGRRCRALLTISTARHHITPISMETK